jgi:hypothetical protein
LITDKGRVRVPSALIGVLQRQCGDIDHACPDPEPAQLTSLAEALGQLPDSRRVRGCRYRRLGSLLALCLVAVLGGAVSPAAIARFAADTDAVDLLAAAFHACQTVTAQRQSRRRATKSPLSPRCWTGSTCGASSSPPMRCHTQRAHAEHVIVGG